MDGGGTGLVTLVIPLVKLATLPKTFDEKFCTPLTTEAAKADPGRLGSDTVRPPPSEGVEADPAVEVPIVDVRAKVGS